jgi:predicted metal-binding membrane protein
MMFAGGYLAVWIVYGLAAYGAQQALTGRFAWDSTGRYAAGAVVVLAGIYQLTPLKRACLSHCRSPLGFLLTKWRRGPVGPAWMGAHHGLYCTGCCAALMAVLFALGVMSLFWMAVVAAAVFLEKVAPHGDRLIGPIALVLIGLGVWVALGGLVHPASGM